MTTNFDAATYKPPHYFKENEVPGMTDFLNTVKFTKDNLVPVIVQDMDTGDILMQAFADRAAINETLQTKLATFYSRSRQGRWCKGETSGHFIEVNRVFLDCDRDSLIYLSKPIGPACHTGSKTCYFEEVLIDSGSSPSDPPRVSQERVKKSDVHAPLTTLYALEKTIRDRKQALEDETAGRSSPVPGAKPSWTAKLLGKPTLLCKKIREEASELCETLEKKEGADRAASEFSDLIYHAMVLLSLQGVEFGKVLGILRKRFAQSGIEERAKRAPKAGDDPSKNE
nr:phosphoribosyl-ATP pyrophosphohydrolase/phosphoribosyl-AMP cyclohydrolase (hisIE) [Polytomella parva]|eukprot:CAMPEP_0175045828 /NCGR_PEP_ID=MMETSP0052_2-20121109/4673_1 /TAXON_ID=51329 ORGANISM="Polytomella parva, Strain SAG 63-3" /NCGR_SAMPLE_ID=MMETSP0052_2 /ASSEMBLY_ACC=CAM_ASM_000194 /LENGTH=283 /DNA_ID=CAMNT_0016309469 /DNA_START=112 /DNA_END=963 /DNA_ORIENTATION=-